MLILLIIEEEERELEITIQREHKSIKPTSEFKLPNFTKLTGINGSGKTHLLEALADLNKTTVNYEGERIKNIKYIPFNGLNPNIIDHCRPETLVQLKKQAWNELKAVTRNERFNGYDETRILQRITNEKNKTFITQLKEETGKGFRDFEESDFLRSYNIISPNQNDIFASQFAIIFKNYQKKYEKNEVNLYRLSIGKTVTEEVYSEEEFYVKYGKKPWEFINSLLEELSIPYEVNNPESDDTDAEFFLKLVNEEEVEIDLKDLSTGEKVMMSLALAIYNTGNGMGKPELLILDEPDAPLHPSMSKKMIDVLSKKIVEENNIPVIITTHSPSTIIASKENAIYKLEKGVSSPQKITKDEAVELLSGEIPFLKISNEKRRQVFVEHKYDTQYYERLTNILSRQEVLSSEPIFIPARTSEGSNCSDVISVVNSLYSNGNDQIYGIIDWDLRNSSENRIIVLGQGKRYAIENYLLDPLKVGMFLLRENFICFSDIENLSIDSYIRAKELTKEDAQLIINKVLNELGLYSENKISYKLYNGWELETTKEFNEHQGHSLEKKYKEKFPQLGRYNNENALKNEIIQKVFNDLPEFIPDEIFETLRQIK